MTTPPRLLALPIADRETASSRLRLHDLLTAAGDRVVASVLRPGAAADADPLCHDVLYIQKDASPPALRLARMATAASVPIIYDIDDDFGCWPGMNEAEMCRLASVITVDSPARAEALRAASLGRVEIVPCMIDLAKDAARDRAVHHAGPASHVVTFGNHGSVVAAREWLQYVGASRTVIAVGPPSAAADAGGPRLVPFKLNTFLDELVAADVLLVAHNPAPGALKDNNRLVLAMSLGKPTLCSPSPAYVDTVAGLGLDWLVCEPRDIEVRLRQLDDPYVRVQVGERLRRAAWSAYAPEHCADVFLKLIDDVVSGAERR